MTGSTFLDLLIITVLLASLGYFNVYVSKDEEKRMNRCLEFEEDVVVYASYRWDSKWYAVLAFSFLLAEVGIFVRMHNNLLAFFQKYLGLFFGSLFGLLTYGAVFILCFLLTLGVAFAGEEVSFDAQKRYYWRRYGVNLMPPDKKR